MNEETLKARLADIKKYLNQKWYGMSDHFVERLVLRAEYSKLLKRLKENKNG